MVGKDVRWGEAVTNVSVNWGLNMYEVVLLTISVRGRVRYAVFRIPKICHRKFS